MPYNSTAARIILMLMLSFAGFTLQAQDLPKEFEQILPRGRIAAITHPHFVPAEKAVIAPNSYVLGVVIDGEARAYSLNLLNAHEVVNDKIGDHLFAAVW